MPPTGLCNQLCWVRSLSLAGLCDWVELQAELCNHFWLGGIAGCDLRPDSATGCTLCLGRAIGRALQLDWVSCWLFDYAGLQVVPWNWVRWYSGLCHPVGHWLCYPIGQGHWLGSLIRRGLELYPKGCGARDYALWLSWITVQAFLSCAVTGYAWWLVGVTVWIRLQAVFSNQTRPWAEWVCFLGSVAGLGCRLSSEIVQSHCPDSPVMQGQRLCSAVW